MTSIQIAKRDGNKKSHVLRKEGYMPAVYYGRTQTSTPVVVKSNEFERVWREAGESTVVTLESPDGQLDALITDVDFDPVTYLPRHADFYVFEEGRKVEVAVPLEFVGVSPAVKEQGAILVKVMHELRVEASPHDLPGYIEVDVSGLKDLDSQVLADELVLPKGVELIEDPQEVVAAVSSQEKEAEEDDSAGGEVDFSSIEVEKKGKEEEGEAEE